MSASPDPDPRPDWRLMYAFPWAPGAAVVVVGIPYGCWAAQEGNVNKWNAQLKYLEDGWSFKDSVASDVTLFAAAFTGVFGASGVLEVLGDKTESVLAVAAVGAAVGVGLVGAGPFVVQALRVAGEVTASGFVPGAVVTTAGTAGRLWAALLAARDLELGPFGDRALVTVASLASALLAFYAWRNTLHSLDVGSQPSAGLSSNARRFIVGVGAVAEGTVESRRSRPPGVQHPPAPVKVPHLLLRPMVSV